MTFLESRCDGAVGTIIMNNDAKRNVICAGFIESLLHTLEDFRLRQLRVVILRANPGTKVWSAGHDVSELPPLGHDPLHWAETLPRLVRAIQLHPVPVFAMVEGSVWGGACEMAMACDMVVAARSSTFAITPAKLGLPYNVNGLSTFTRVISPHILREMLFTAQPLTAERLAAAGAINYAVDTDRLEGFCYELAAHICENSPRSIAAMKESLRALIGARELSAAEFERLEELRQAVYNSADYAEGLDAIKHKRKPVFVAD